MKDKKIYMFLYDLYGFEKAIHYKHLVSCQFLPIISEKNFL